MDNEEWRGVVGFESLYEVSDLGRVRSLPRYRVKGRVLKPQPAGAGYFQVALGAKARAYVHHLVAAAFIGPRPEGLNVLHGGANMTDNRAVNLRYGTQSANNRDAVKDGTNYESRQTHCDNGHEYTPDNTMIHRNGTYADGTGVRYRRRCKQCVKAKTAKTKYTI